MDWSGLKAASDEQSGKIWLVIAFLLVATLAFEAGWLKRSLGETEPLVISTPVVIPAPALPERLTAVASQAAESSPPEKASEAPTNCAFVGSKNSNKYHLPLSHCAKQIKSENRLCFDSVETAKSKGYLPGCLK